MAPKIPRMLHQNVARLIRIIWPRSRPKPIRIPTKYRVCGCGDLPPFLLDAIAIAKNKEVGKASGAGGGGAAKKTQERLGDGGAIPSYLLEAIANSDAVCVEERVAARKTLEKMRRRREIWEKYRW